MRALIILTLLLLTQFTMAQDQTPVVENQNLTETQEPEVTVAPRNTGFVFNPTVTLTSRKLEFNDQQVGKMRVVQFDSKVGYVFNFGLFAGAQLNYTTGSMSSGGAADTDVSTHYAGPTVGYSSESTGFFVSATYHLLGSSTMAGLGKYEKIQGLQVDIAYPMTVNENLKFGPQVSIKHLDLKEGTSGLADDKFKEVTPYFGLWLYF